MSSPKTHCACKKGHGFRQERDLLSDFFRSCTAVVVTNDVSIFGLSLAPAHGTPVSVALRSPVATRAHMRICVHTYIKYAGFFCDKRISPLESPFYLHGAAQMSLISALPHYQGSSEFPSNPVGF